MEIRTLKAEEIECRVQSVLANGCILLIYKDARVDMKILDEVFGIDGWQRTHEVINGNLFCTIKIWNEKAGCWISKQDVGTESNTEKQKGEASDSFKRAGFNVGIGRELYSAPFTWVNLAATEVSEYNGRKQLAKGIKFVVSKIGYDTNRDIDELVIVDQSGNVRFELKKQGVKATATKSAPINTIISPKADVDKAFEAALGEMNKCKDIQSVTDCWNKYPQYKEVESFKNATIEVRKTFKN